MGGICFLLSGNMIGGVGGPKSMEHGYLFRVGKENEAEALARPGARPLEMGGRRMGGMVIVEAEDCDDAAFRAWVSLALGFVSGLPEK